MKLNMIKQLSFISLFISCSICQAQEVVHSNPVYLGETQFNINVTGGQPRGFSEIVINSFLQDQAYIEDFQEANSRLFDVIIDEELQLPYNYLTLGQEPAKYCNPTEIGLWLVYLTDVAKGDIAIDNISQEQALNRLDTALKSIVDLPKWNGLLYWYDISSANPVKTDYGWASAVDNANFAASLAVVVGAFLDQAEGPTIANSIVTKAQQLIFGQQDGWVELYNEEEGMMYGDERKDRTIDRFCTEERLAPLMAIVLADVDSDVWTNLEIVQSEYTLSNGENIDIVPPWQGAFQIYMPLIFIPEGGWSDDWQNALKNYGAAQIDYCNSTNLYALRSACSDPATANYSYYYQAGVPGASESSVSGGVGATYGAALMRLVLPDQAIDLMQRLEDFTSGEIYGPYGMIDSIDSEGNMSNTYVALDHLMMTVAMAGEVNQEYFVRYLESINKLSTVEDLYQGLDMSIEPANIPTVESVSEVVVSENMLLDFENNSNEMFSFWDGPSGDISCSIADGSLKVSYNTPEYNGVEINFEGDEAFKDADYLLFDIKSSAGLDQIKIEIKGQSGSLAAATIITNIVSDEWMTIKIPISEFNLDNNEIASIDSFYLTIEGWRLPVIQQEGVFYLDNIRIQ